VVRKKLRFACLYSCLGASLWAAPQLQAAAPEPSDPDGKLEVGQGPGIFPTTVTGANVNIAPLPGGELNGANQNNLKVTCPSAGPIKWTESRHNEGDVAMLIGPQNPDDPTFYPPDDFFDDYKPYGGQPDSANTALAWRVNRDLGALMATVRHNGVDQGILANGSPMGITHGVAYFNSGFGQGWGFRMSDGVFANGGGPSADLQMGVAGNDGGAGEASFDVATAFFPYEQGWLGGWVAGAADELGVITSGSPNLPVEVASWSAPTGEIADGALGHIKFPGIDSSKDGMLFVAASNSDNNTRIAAGSPRAGGWDVAVREDNDSDQTGATLVVPNKSDYQFLYVPYTAGNLVGGHVLGDGTVHKAAGTSRFSLARRSEGEYAISVKDVGGNTLGENDGVLVLSVAGTVGAPGSLPDRSFMSYEYDEAAKAFVVQARQLTETNSPASQNVFGDKLALTNTDFYFAFVDFKNPLTPTSVAVPGDFDADGQLSAADIDALSAQVRAGSNNAAYDLNADSKVNDDDRQVWIVNLKKTYSGDANLDLQFDSGDFVEVFQKGKYETGGAAGWGEGDWNGDALFDSGDFVSAFQMGGYEKGPRAAVAAVPEPASFSMMVLAGLALAGLARRR